MSNPLRTCGLRPTTLRTESLRIRHCSIPPIPTEAWYDAVPHDFFVRFGVELAEGALDESNWKIRIGSLVYAGDTAAVTWYPPDEVWPYDLPSYVVKVELKATSIEDPGDPVCWFDPPPYDLFSVYGVPAQGFDDLAYTEV